RINSVNYGKDNNSRIYNPSDLDPAHPTQIFSWLICSTYDDKGNALVYEYAAENAVGVDRTQANERHRVRNANRYLKRIKYGNRTSRLIQPDLTLASWLFEVVFDYDEGYYTKLALDPARPASEQQPRVLASSSTDEERSARLDAFSSYRSGFEVRTYRRCRRILMFHRFAELGDAPYLVRSTEFEYADLDYRQAVPVDSELAHEGSTRFASFIQSITQSGYVRDDTQLVVNRNGVQYFTYIKRSLPPLEFEYSKAKIQEELRELDTDSLKNLPAGVDGTLYQWVDLDGEGASGILTEQGGECFYKPSLGAGRFGPLQILRSKPAAFALASGGTQLLDLAGDGQLDVVAFSGPAPGFYERTQEGGWKAHRSFRSLPSLDFQDPNLRFVDLDGDGHADILVTENECFTWYPSLAEDGFGPANRIRQATDEEHGPRLVFADNTQSIYLADFSGDGLTDLVRIRNGEVCYWPNLGYGHFGAKIIMDNAPRFDLPDQFDQKRIRLADIDGSGTTDVIYWGRDGVRLYFNQSGNRLTAARQLSEFPKADSLCSVTTVDLLGNGTACLVWSSSLPADSKRPLRYIDLMGGQKPHLLVRSKNNLGAETRVDYVASTKFYFADKLAGKPWVTRIAFPVHVIERVTTYDHISGNRFVSRYAYHHGYFDGIEREFRGFGMVEQTDTEEFAAFAEDDTRLAATNTDAAFHVPPVLTKTWFHTGLYVGRNHVSDFFAGFLDDTDIGEYYREPGVTDAQARDLLLPDTVMPSGLSPDEEREACRALKGMMLRQEIYALDHTDKEAIPFTVTEQNFT
ncbi:MAG TPA: SpvB/TcaC N-terminal domain-containing protein, partial [Polyangiaceae bacterium]